MGGNDKTPPAWGPEMEDHVPFVNFVQDLTTWSLGTEVDTDKQAHRAVLRLSGVARALAREVDPNILSNGEVVDLNDGAGPTRLSGIGALSGVWRKASDTWRTRHS